MSERGRGLAAVQGAGLPFCCVEQGCSEGKKTKVVKRGQGSYWEAERANQKELEVANPL